MRITTLALLSVAFALTLPLNVQGQVFRWVDKDGKVHYSDHAPQDANARDLGIDSKPSDPEAAEKTMAELRAQNQGLDEVAAQQREAADQKAVDATRKAQRCEQAQAQLRLLEAVNRSFSVDAKGNRVYDSEQQLQQRRTDARKTAAEACG